MQIKANPFLFFAEDYHEFNPMVEFLKELFPGMDVHLEEINMDAVEEIENLDEVKVGSGFYAAWIKIQPEVKPALTVDNVINAVTETIKILNGKAANAGNDRQLVKTYQADADDYMKIRQKLRGGEVKEALVMLADLDTASREKIWDAETIKRNKDGFAKFLADNEYPNILENGSIY